MDDSGKIAVVLIDTALTHGYISRLESVSAYDTSRQTAETWVAAGRVAEGALVIDALPALKSTDETTRMAAEHLRLLGPLVDPEGPDGPIDKHYGPFGKAPANWHAHHWQWLGAAVGTVRNGMIEGWARSPGLAPEPADEREAGQR